MPALHDQMKGLSLKATHDFGMQRLLKNFVENSGIKAAEQTPIEMLSPDEQVSSHVVNGLYPDFNGPEKTSQTVQKFLDDSDILVSNHSNSKNSICFPKKFVFLKNHKAGSTTLRILLKQ